MDWSNFKVRCSALGCLFVEPKSKADRDAGELSGTAKTYLAKAYIMEFWGRSKDITTKQINKGNLAEDEVISLLGFVDNKMYTKNTERKSNEWISGHADIVDEIIIDAKASWDAETFIPKLTEPLDKTYYYQLQGYMWLYGRKKGRVSYGLVNCPDMILQNERRKLLFNMNVATELSPEYLEAAMELDRNLIFDDIDPFQRVISIDVDLDEEVISQIPGKVKKARQFLSWLEQQHLSGRKYIPAAKPIIPISSIPIIKIK